MEEAHDYSDDDDSLVYLARYLDILSGRGRTATTAKPNIWGYNLFQAPVEFPPDVFSSLRNNRPPSQVTLQSAMAFKEAPAAHVAKVDVQIAEIDKTIKELQQQKAMLWNESRASRTKLIGCNTVLTTIRRLPLDVIGEIALFALPEHPTPSNRQSPMNLSQVSSYWRSAVLSMPRLWTTLYVSVKPDAQWFRTAHQTREFLKHAQGSLFSLFLFFEGTNRGPFGSEATQHIQFFLSRIAPLMSQAKRLAIGAAELSNIWEHLGLEGRTDWKLERLVHLHIRNENNTADCDAFSDMMTFNESPITHLHAKGRFITRVDYNTIVNWSSLIDLRLTDDLSLEIWTSIMDLCPQLEVGQFPVWNEEQEHLRTGPPCIHSALHNLSIHVNTDSTPLSVFALLSQFHLPALTRLHFSSEVTGRFNWEPSTPSPSSFAPLSRLRYLSLDQMWEDPGFYVDVLRAATSLEELAFNSCPKRTALLMALMFEAMTLNREQGSSHATAAPILPNLRILTIPISYQRSIIVDETENTSVPHVNCLIEMAKARRPSQVPQGYQALGKIVFFRRRSKKHPQATCILSPKLEEGLSVCQIEGMKIICVRLDESFEDGILMHPFDTWRPLGVQ